MVEALPHDEAVTQLEGGLLAQWPGSTRVSCQALATRFPQHQQLSAVWRLVGAGPQGPHDLLLAIDQNFPWSLPRIFLPDATDAITYPHVEADGHLCLTRSDDAFDVPVGMAHVRELIESANALLAAGVAGANVDDFLDEAPSYWCLTEPAAGELLLSCPFSGTTIAYSAPLGRDVVVSDAADNLKGWFKGLGARLERVEPALLVALPMPLHPSAYPLTLSDLFQLIDNAGAMALLDRCLSTWRLRTPIAVVLSFNHDGRQILLGASIPPPGTLRMPGVRKVGLPGFRYTQGSPRAKRNALAKYPGRFPHLTAVPVHRDFLLERTAGAVDERVRKGRVAVIGCGALGGPIALQLLQAGVGHVLLVDHDRFDWRNIGRHVLDATVAGTNKAEALARAAIQRFPDADVSARGVKWQSLLRDSPKDLQQCDLIISCTAHAASNLHMDYLIEQGELPAAVFAWVEPKAFASHAVYRATTGVGLDRVIGKDGLMLEPVIDLASAPSLAKEPACGALYQPFSALNAVQGVHLTAELALNVLNGGVTASVQRSWIGREDALHSEGLLLSAAWGSRIHQFGFARRYDHLLLPQG